MKNIRNSFLQFFCLSFYKMLLFLTDLLATLLINLPMPRIPSIVFSYCFPPVIMLIYPFPEVLGSSSILCQVAELCKHFPYMSIDCFIWEESSVGMLLFSSSLVQAFPAYFLFVKQLILSLWGADLRSSKKRPSYILLYSRLLTWFLLLAMCKADQVTENAADGVMFS